MMASAERTVLLSARDVCWSRSGRTVLSHVDLQVHAGEIVTLIGPNGAGKSTLVKIMLGLLSPDSGHVRGKRGLRIGYVPQQLSPDPALPLSVQRLMTLTIRADRNQVETALAKTGVAHLREAAVTELSGGELQRVALARALLRRPEVLVLDEPTQGVDYAGAAELYHLITAIRDQCGCGVLLISHDLQVVMASADRVVCLNHHVCCEGHPKTVGQDSAYAALFGPQAVTGLGLYAHHHDHAHAPDGTVIAPDEWRANEDPSHHAG